MNRRADNRKLRGFAKLKPAERIAMGKRGNAALTREHRTHLASAGPKGIKAWWAKLTQEEKSAIIKARGQKISAAARRKTQKQRRAIGLKAAATRMTRTTKEQQSTWGRKGGKASMAKLTKDERKAKGEKGYAAGLAKLSRDERIANGRRSIKVRALTKKELSTWGKKGGAAFAARLASLKAAEEELLRLKAIESGAAVSKTSRKKVGRPDDDSLRVYRQWCEDGQPKTTAEIVDGYGQKLFLKEFSKVKNTIKPLRKFRNGIRQMLIRQSKKKVSGVTKLESAARLS